MPPSYGHFPCFLLLPCSMVRCGIKDVISLCQLVNFDLNFTINDPSISTLFKLDCLFSPPPDPAMPPTLPVSLSPHICVVSSPDVEVALRSAALPPLPQLLQSFSPLSSGANPCEILNSQIDNSKYPLMPHILPGQLRLELPLRFSFLSLHSGFPI